MSEWNDDFVSATHKLNSENPRRTSRLRRIGDSGLQTYNWLIFTLTTSLALFLSAVTSNKNTTVASAAVAVPIVETASTTLVAAPEIKIEAKAKPVDQPISVEQYVRTYFAKTPILAEVAKCESQFRQFDGKTGKVLHGRAVFEDIGVMQINETYHLETAKKLGYDIYTLEGNLAYGQYLYDHQGTQPWSASAPCWDK